MGSAIKEEVFLFFLLSLLASSNLTTLHTAWIVVSVGTVRKGE